MQKLYKSLIFCASLSFTAGYSAISLADSTPTADPNVVIHIQNAVGGTIYFTKSDQRCIHNGTAKGPASINYMQSGTFSYDPREKGCPHASFVSYEANIMGSTCVMTISHEGAFVTAACPYVLGPSPTDPDGSTYQFQG